MPTLTAPSPGSANSRVTLAGVSWTFYQSMLAEIGDGHIRLTFDTGRLEIISPSSFHEQVKKVLARLIEAYGEEADVVVEGFGSTTFDREDLQKGIEPDECYYIQHAANVIGKEDFDWTIDPPPDLAIEIDISPPGVARQPIYAALGVPEIWRYDGRTVVSLQRDATHATRYVPSSISLAFPSLPMDELNRFLQLGLTSGQAIAVKALRDWARTSG